MSATVPNIDVAGQIAQQGFGYLLFIGALIVAYFLYKEARDAHAKRVEDTKSLVSLFITTTKDLLNGNANLQKSIDKITEILENTRFKKGV